MTFEGRMGRAAGLAGAFGGIVFALLASSGTSRSANAFQKDGEFPKPADEIKLLKSSECKLCHSELNASAKEAYQNTKGFEFIRLWENEVWSQHDPHSKAFENLATSLTKDAKMVNAAQGLLAKICTTAKPMAAEHFRDRDHSQLDRSRCTQREWHTSN